MSDQDHADRARRALWAVRTMLADTPMAGTIAPGLRGVYKHADDAHSALTLTGDVVAALKAARTARSTVQAATIDVARLESWLGADARGETAESFLRQVYVSLDAAVRALEVDIGMESGR